MFLAKQAVEEPLGLTVHFVLTVKMNQQRFSSL